MSKKLKSSFKNMVLVLFLVTLIASTAVAYMNELTKTPIAQAKLDKQIKAIKDVVPAFTNNPFKEKIEIKEDDKHTIIIFPAKKNGELIGTAVKTYTNKAFGGEFWIMVGFKPDGTIINYSVLEHKETPGLGSKMDLWFKGEGKKSIINKNPSTTKFIVSKDGGDIDAITAATISSRAFLDAIDRGYKAFLKQTK